MAGQTHWVTTKSGDTYTGRDGVEREGYVQIGKLIENAKGNKIIILESIPFSWLGGGKPVALYLKAMEPKNGDGAERPAPPPKKPVDLDDDLPF